VGPQNRAIVPFQAPASQIPPNIRLAIRNAHFLREVSCARFTR
jgi:hypothetical protein